MTHRVEYAIKGLQTVGKSSSATIKYRILAETLLQRREEGSTAKNM
jgi:hypothetical protein